MTDLNLKHISKCMSHALRHKPWLYELELDEEGWVPLEMLLSALRSERAAWQGLQRPDIEELMRTAPKERFQIKGDHIRAIYGHSLPGALRHEPADPPETLYHGTNPDLVQTIMEEGLRPMSRQYVHLSADAETALEVGRRKAGKPVLLRVDTASATRAGVTFFRGNDKVWLASKIPGEFLS